MASLHNYHHKNTMHWMRVSKILGFWNKIKAYFIKIIGFWVFNNVINLIPCYGFKLTQTPPTQQTEAKSPKHKSFCTDHRIMSGAVVVRRSKEKKSLWSKWFRLMCVCVCVFKRWWEMVGVIFRRGMCVSFCWVCVYKEKEDMRCSLLVLGFYDKVGCFFLNCKKENLIT